MSIVSNTKILLMATMIELFLWLLVGIFGKVGADGFNETMNVFLWAHLGAQLIWPDPSFQFGIGYVVYFTIGVCQWIVLCVGLMYIFKYLKNGWRIDKKA
jgi:hypothetical protein